MLLMFDQVASARTFPLAYLTTSLRGLPSLAIGSMRPRNFLQTIESGLAGRKVSVLSQRLML
jgi:hypothetical protein